MDVRRSLATAAVVAVALAAAPAIRSDRAGAAEQAQVARSYVVPTRHGKIYVEVVRPAAGRVPAILTYSPYSVLGRNGDASQWVPHGYARVWADVVGTGNSGGCYDYGGVRERESAHDVVEWLARRPWSTGKVAMMGGSYNGTTAVAAAVERPPHLTTIVPEAAISRWYEYAFSGGIRYFWTNEPLGNQGPGSGADEGFDTPLAFDFGFAVPPPVDAGGPDWAERVESTMKPCDELEHTAHGYDFETPNYGRFWRQRDYVRRAGAVDIPVLVAHNWGDWNVKQEEAWNLFRALDGSRQRVMYMGTRWDGHGRPGGDYDAFRRAWLDHYLLGETNGIEDAPSVVTQTSDHAGPGDWLSGRPLDVAPVELIAQQTPVTSLDDYAWKLLPTRPGALDGVEKQRARFPSTGLNTESDAALNPRGNLKWFWFETPPLTRDVRIFGSMKVRIYSTVARKWITYTPSVFDVVPSQHVTVGGQQVATDPRALVAVTRGWLDSRYRNGLRRLQAVEPNEPFGMTVVAKPQDYVFRAGHRIGVSIQTEINEWSIPKAYAGCEGDPAARCALVRVNWEGGRTRLVLPVVDAPRDPTRLFAGDGWPHH